MTSGASQPEERSRSVVCWNGTGYFCIICQMPLHCATVTFVLEDNTISSVAELALTNGQSLVTFSK